MSVDAERLYRIVGERIRRSRGRIKGMSQAKLASKLGISRASIVNIEAGRQRAPLHLLWEIAEHLETELYLLVPRQREYQEDAEPVKLDPGTIAEIERAASGDPATRRDLTRFIVKAKERAMEAP